MTFTYPSHTTKGCVPLSSDVNVDYYIISNYDQSKVAWQLGLNTYVIGGQISENEAKEIIDSIT